MFRRNFLQIAGVGLASTVTGLPSFAKEEKPKYPLVPCRPLCTGDENLDKELLSANIENVAIRVSINGVNHPYSELFIENLRKNNDESLVSIIQYNKLYRNSHNRYDKKELKTRYNFIVCRVMQELISPLHFNIYPHKNDIVVFPYYHNLNL